MNNEITPEQENAIWNKVNELRSVSFTNDRKYLSGFEDGMFYTIANPSKYGLSTPVTDEQLRKEILELLNLATLPKESEWLSYRLIALFRKHSVTPVLSEQQIKEEAEKRFPLQTEGYLPDRAIINEYQRAKQKGYIAALTAHPKQQGEEVESDYLMCECGHTSFYHELRKLKCSECDCKAFHLKQHTE